MKICGLSNKEFKVTVIKKKLTKLERQMDEQSKNFNKEERVKMME